MKRNQNTKSYGTKLIRRVKSRDFDRLRIIRDILTDVSVFVRGMVYQIGEEHSMADIFDYIRFEKKSRSYYSRIETYTNSQYDKIVREIRKIQREIYYMYRKDFAQSLRKMDMVPKIVSEAAMNVSFGGTPNQSFTKHLRGQLRAGHNPAALIKTVSQQHVQLIQKQLSIAVSKGQGFGWAKNRVLKEIYPVGVDRMIKKQMEYNVTRIMRTSYMQAVNLDTTDFVADNSGIFYGSRRLASGGACFACIILDGKFYSPGEVMQDHPNGQCVLVPLSYPDEYFETGKITKPMGDDFGPSMLQKFYAASESEQMKMIGNKSLYRLWKTEQFDPSKLITGPFKSSTMSYQRAVAELPKLGGISNPIVGFLNPGLKSRLNRLLDPSDRIVGKQTVSKWNPALGIDSRGINLVGDGSDFLVSKIPDKLKARIMALTGEGTKLDWLAFNERARLLGIATRKDMTGKLYYMVDSEKLKALRKAIHITKAPLKSELGKYLELDRDIDLIGGKGIDKIRWNAQGNARIVRDAELLEGQELRVYKMYDKASKKTYYSFEFKYTEESANKFEKFLIKRGEVSKETVAFRVNKKSGKRLLKEELHQHSRKVTQYNVKGTGYDLQFHSSTSKIASYSSRTFVDCYADNLEGAIKIFEGASRDYKFKKVLDTVDDAATEVYLKNRVKWADRDLHVPFDLDDITLKDVNGYSVFSKKLPDKLLDDVSFLLHETDNLPGLVSIFDSKTFMSTDVRTLGGTGNIRAGKSAMADIESGGSSSVFTRLVPKKTEGYFDDFASDHTYKIIIDKKELNRLDWYGFSDDSYGDIGEIASAFRGRSSFIAEQTAQEIGVGQFGGAFSRNEVMFRNYVSTENVLRIEVSNDAVREKVIASFRKKGITVINGTSVEDFVQCL